MFTITPLTESEIDELSLLPEGTYNFEVSNCVKKPSKKGNPMAEIDLTVWDNNGKTHFVKDWLVFSQVGLCIRKIKHFCEATGIEGEYLAGSIRENFTGLSGKVNIGIREEIPKEGGGFHPKKNYVIDYLVTPKESGTMPLKSNSTETGMIDDDVPF